ncbi:transcriptional regulator [Acinetobacter sp. ANC 7454]|uniref:transcriptional regulator n=1 Tax=Acinetobacter thermotolerans TaxID=3151487 RepID=UPI00325B97E0
MKTYDNNVHKNQLNPRRLKKKVVCDLLGISVNHLRKISLADESFPKPLKSGTARQAGVYYDYQEILEWHKKQLELR